MKFAEGQQRDDKNVVEYFKKEQLDGVLKQRKKTLLIYFIVFGAYLLLCAGMLWWYMTLPYKTWQNTASEITKIKLIQYFGSALFAIFSFVYLGIIYKRVNKFYKLCAHMLTGIKEVYTGSFLEYDEQVQVKDGVDFKSLVFIEWNKYKNDFFERKVLVFEERPFPEIPEKANVRYVTQGNVLLNYEILS